MGLFWDLIQQSQISDHQARAASLEDRVRHLEAELAETRATLHELLRRLEMNFQTDLNDDGRIG